jgi:hypothetical protein
LRINLNYLLTLSAQILSNNFPNGVRGSIRVLVLIALIRDCLPESVVNNAFVCGNISGYLGGSARRAKAD